MQTVIFIPVEDDKDDDEGIPKFRRMVAIPVMESIPAPILGLISGCPNFYPLEVHELHDYVTGQLQNKQLVSPDLARRFLNNLHYGGFSEIDPALQAAGIVGMRLEDKLTLYESIAQERNPQNLKWLSALNAGMGLGADFYAEQAKETAKFAERENLKLLFERNPNLIVGLARLLNNPASVRDDIKEAIYQELTNAYCDFRKIPRSKVHFYNDKDPCLQGFYSPRDGSISMNRNTKNFGNNPLRTIETLIGHEAKHAQEYAIAKDLRAGKIQPGDPNYIAARVFNANINMLGGYIAADCNYEAYQNQPAEIDARTSGEAMFEILSKNVGYIVQLADAITDRNKISSTIPALPIRAWTQRSEFALPL